MSFLYIITMIIYKETKNNLETDIKIDMVMENACQYSQLSKIHEVYLRYSKMEQGLQNGSQINQEEQYECLPLYIT